MSYSLFGPDFLLRLNINRPASYLLVMPVTGVILRLFLIAICFVIAGLLLFGLTQSLI
jgi:hypothetical protein